MTPDELAERHWQDYRARQPGTCFADPGFTLDLAQAYALQDAVASLRVAAGDRVAGFKVGCTGAGTVAQFGMAGPIRGFLFDSEIHRSGQILDKDAFAHLAIEGEMVLRIGDDGRIAAMFPVIELHHFLFRRARKTLVELVANNGLNAGIVLPGPEWQAAASLPEAASLSVRVNGAVLGQGALWPMPGGPSASLDWLADQLGSCGLALAPGQIVLAGTPLGLYPVGPGDRIGVFIDDRLAVQCSVSP